MTRAVKRRGFTLVEVMLAMFVVAIGVLAFAALYPTAAKSSRMNGFYAQAISAGQHKVDQLRAVGYGRLTYSELRAAGIIDAAPTLPPYRFEAIDALDVELPQAIGTIDVRSAAPDLAEVTVQITWGSRSIRSMKGENRVVTLIANE